MALGFIKKIFSFARSDASEPVGAEEERPQEAAVGTPEEAPSVPLAGTAFAEPDAVADEAFPEPGAREEARPPEPVRPIQEPSGPEGPPLEAQPISESPLTSSESGAEAQTDSAPQPQPGETSFLPPDEVTGRDVGEDASDERREAVASTELPEPIMLEGPAPRVPTPPDETPVQYPPLRENGGSPVTGALPQPPSSPPSGRLTVAKSVERKVEPEPIPAAPPKQSWFQRLRSGLSRSSKELGDNLAGIFTKGRLTEEIVEELEEVLIRADLGMETAMRVTDALESGRYGRQTTEADVRAVMAAEIAKVLTPVALPLELDLSVKPHVMLVVGVNGTGKTTTIGKLAAKLVSGGLSVTLAAGDTFRAAAIEQLKIWGERTGSPVVSSKLGADAAGLAYDAFEKARAAGSDVLIIDTAGRLQNKTELMAELEKIVRVLRKLDPEAPHTVLQTVDATTGQNALNQVEIFRNVAGVNGLVMTKLDGTARGGILVAIAAKHKLPVYFIGVGEQVDDLEPFSADEFARAIAGVA
ncbi:MAG: signal recognition particle-docking protein FtsY [Rhizobiaceae bacterium]|nr:signal recognition particle-docking protein FtsY [Rhizobiaceae bacterium]MCV0404631.1 signal recognition particle-docking protein FtsY [Rhizobiaceae bacterium]